MIELRPFTQDDQPIMLDILTDSRIKQTYMLPDYERKEDASPLFRRLMELSIDQKRFVRGIFLHSQLIGFMNDVEINEKNIELGYVIHPDYQGRGYMTKALEVAIRELFAHGYREVLAGSFTENMASIRVMEHVGMRKLPKCDQIEYRGKTRQCVYYSIQKQE